MVETTLAERLTKIVKVSGKSKTAFARSLGITRNYLHVLLSGQKVESCSQTLALLIEKTYGYPADWVLTGNVTDSHPMKEIADKLPELDIDDMKKVSAFIDTLKGDTDK